MQTLVGYLEDLLSAKKDKIVVFMAGGVGVGKSSFSKIIFGDSFKDFISIRPDALLERVEQMQGELPEKKRKEVVARSKESAMKQFKKRTGEYYNVVLDRTAKNVAVTLADKKKLEDAGYTTYMVFVYTTDVNIALERNAARKRKEPENVVREYAKAAKENSKKYKGIFGTKFLAIKSDTHFASLSTEDKLKLITLGKDVKKAIVDDESINGFNKKFKAVLG